MQDKINKKLLGDYYNGPVHVQLFDDGTKTREWDEKKYGLIPEVEFPESIDIKLTNYCQGSYYNEKTDTWTVCPFCHENSGPSGKHGDLMRLAELIRKSNMPIGWEMALGGGAVQMHPGLKIFLEMMWYGGYCCNMTVNYNHLILQKSHNYVKRLLDYYHVKGLGISVNEQNIAKFVKDESINALGNNVVMHVIEGLVDYYTFADALKDCIFEYPKVLILGKKDFGRYLKEPVAFRHADDRSSAIWKEHIIDFLKMFRGVVSFDNLAIERLNILNRIPAKVKEEHYLGEEGSCSMYIDAVEWTYAKQSTSKLRKPIGNLTIREMFKDVSQNRKEWK